RAGESSGVQLDQAGGYDPAQGATPGDHALWFSDSLLEEIEQRYLVLERILDRPAGRGVGGSRDRVVMVEQPGPCRGEWRRHRAVRSARGHVTVTEEEEGLIPLGGHHDLVGGGADLAGPVGWSGRLSGGRLGAGGSQREEHHHGQGS